MEGEALKYIGIGLLSLGMLGAAIGVSNIFIALLNGLSRNPSSEDKLKKYFLMGAGLVEAMGIFSVLLAFLILFS